MKSKRVILVGVGGAIVLLVACSATRDFETVGSQGQATITPSYTDVPSPGGSLTVTTPEDGKPTGPGDPNPMPADPAFCYFTKIHGPLSQEGDYIKIDQNSSNVWYGQVPRANAMSFQIGCTKFSSLTNAGNATTEGYSVKESTTSFDDNPQTKNIPTNTSYRTPSFAPLTIVVGRMDQAYPNCNITQIAHAWPTTYGARTVDYTELQVIGTHCPAVLGVHGLYDTSLKVVGHSQTKWSGGNGVIRFDGIGLSDPAGSDMIPTAEGTCWISSIDYHFGGAETAYIAKRLNGSGVEMWTFFSTTANSAYAQCIKYDQS